MPVKKKYDKHKVKILAYQRRRDAEEPNRRNALYRKLGITNEDYERMLAEQCGVCAICGKPPKSKRLHVDHNHKTLKVRGLLCYSCNTKLAFVEKYVKKINAYLRRHRN